MAYNNTLSSSFIPGKLYRVKFNRDYFPHTIILTLLGPDEHIIASMIEGKVMMYIETTYSARVVGNRYEQLNWFLYEGYKGYCITLEPSKKFNLNNWFVPVEEE